MKWRRIVRRVLTTLIAVGIALAVLTVGEGNFQHVVVGALVAVYGLLRLTGIVLEVRFKEAERSTIVRFAQLAHALGNEDAESLFNEEFKAAKEREDPTPWQIQATGYVAIFAAGVIRAIAAVFGL